MEEEIYSINEVVEMFNEFLEENWPGDMEPSKYQRAFDDLDNLGMMSFSEINDAFSLYVTQEDCDFDLNDEEFDKKITEAINEHISYLEEQANNNDYGDEF